MGITVHPLALNPENGGKMIFLDMTINMGSMLNVGVIKLLATALIIRFPALLGICGVANAGKLPLSRIKSSLT
jgi:hypothetical protein